MDTSKIHSVKVLLDCGATRSFIDRDFIHDKKINTWNILYLILVFNVDGTPNKARQIFEVVDVVSWYNTHSV